MQWPQAFAPRLKSTCIESTGEQRLEAFFAFKVMNLNFTKNIVEHPVVSTVKQLETLNEVEVLEGYLSAADIVPWDKSASFVHGWRNRQMDRGAMPHTNESRMLAREWLAAKQRAK